MTVLLNPYISFRDEARAAMEFYQSVLGGELTVMAFGDIGMADDPSEASKVMHAQLTTPNGLTLMGADTPSSMTYTPGAAISVSLSGDPDDEAALRGYFDGLAAGGTVTVPLEKAPWGDTFGMCTDQFGVQWMVNIAGQQPEATA
jgi:PhnB protein